jgi:probable F420-dependent oxidoreductase
MDIGIFTAANADSLPPATLAREIEQRGFESMFVPEHTHIPVDFDTPTPTGEPLPPEYARNFDPFVLLAAAAAATSTLRLGTAVILLAQRDPILFAKEVASLDVLSGGRVELGVGVGWLREEMRNHGTDPRIRVQLVSERLRAAQQIWNNDEAEFHGEHVDFDRILSWPKPVQLPRPPLLLGGWGPSTFARVVAGADGWLAPPDVGATRLAEAIRELQALAAGSGRSPVTVVALTNDPSAAQLDQYAEAGVSRTLLAAMPTSDHAAALRILDSHASFL